jgi:hypothetical protein
VKRGESSRSFCSALLSKFQLYTVQREGVCKVWRQPTHWR